MGCTCTGREISSIEETFFKPFEMSLKMNQLSCKEMGRIFRRFSCKNILNFSQLERACQIIGISVAQYNNFFDFFGSGGKYSARKLSTLGILLGQGTSDEKLTALFENYDENMTNVLKSETVQELVGDILEISCHYIPIYVSWMNKTDEDVQKSSQTTKISTSYLTMFHTDELIENDEFLDKNLFFERFNKISSILLDTQKTRQECLNVYKNEILLKQAALKNYKSHSMNEHKELKKVLTIAEPADPQRKRIEKSLTVPCKTGIYRSETIASRF